MLSWNQIQKMTKDEIARENRRLVRKVVLYRIAIPVAIITAGVLIDRHFDKKELTELATTEEN